MHLGLESTCRLPDGGQKRTAAGLGAHRSISIGGWEELYHERFNGHSPIDAESVPGKLVSSSCTDHDWRLLGPQALDLGACKLQAAGEKDNRQPLSYAHTKAEARASRNCRVCRSSNSTHGVCHNHDESWSCTWPFGP
jgi:hypothetical protein